MTTGCVTGARMAQRDVPEYFAFYPYEFLSDERVIAMTIEQVGAYLLLICSQWVNGSIPSDIPTLARMLKRTTAEMEILWRGVGCCFTEHPELPGRLYQKRVEVERENAITAMTKNRAWQKAYRERKRLEELAKLAGEENVGLTLGGHEDDMNKPSNLLSSYIPKTLKPSKKECENCAEFAALYPAHRLDNYGAQLFASSSPETQAEILEGLRVWVKAEAWTEKGGKFVNKASKFISEKVYAMRPQVPEAPTDNYVRYDD